MNYLNSYDDRFKKRVDDNIESITLNLTNDNPILVNEYLNEEFCELFEDLILEGFFSDLKDKVKDGINYIKEKFKQFLNVIKKAISNFSLKIIFKKIQGKLSKFGKEQKKKLVLALEPLIEPMKKFKFVTPDGKFQTGTTYKKIMSCIKSDSELKGTVDAQKMDQMGNIVADGAFENLTYNNFGLEFNVTELITELKRDALIDKAKKYRGDKFKGYGESKPDDGDKPDGDKPTQGDLGPDKVPGDDKNKIESGTKLTEESFIAGGLGDNTKFFGIPFGIMGTCRKVLFCLGVKEAKLNSILAMVVNSGIMAIIMGGIFTLVMASLTAMGLISGGYCDCWSGCISWYVGTIFNHLRWHNWSIRIIYGG